MTPQFEQFCKDHLLSPGISQEFWEWCIEDVKGRFVDGYNTDKVVPFVLSTPHIIQNLWELHQLERESEFWWQMVQIKENISSS